MFFMIAKWGRRLGVSFGAAGFLALAVLCAFGSASFAQDSDSLLKLGAKALGFATDVPPPADFVTKSRPPADPDFIPVFQPPPEPSRPALKTDELKSMRGDLDSVQKRHDAIRQAYPPAAKALAEAAAAAAAKKNGNSAPSTGQ
jgi:hypothetical protein